MDLNWQYDEKDGQIIKPEKHYDKFNCIMLFLDLLLTTAGLTLTVFFYCCFISYADTVYLFSTFGGIIYCVFFGALSYHCWIYRKEN
jgi:hypothetical protein